MPLDLLAQPVFVLSVLSLAACGAWAVWYLRRSAHHDDRQVQRVAAGVSQGLGSPDLNPAEPIRQPVADPAVPTITFADVAGLDEVVEELREVKDFLTDPERFVRLGAKLPRGILLVGPPGTGKTLLTKALAGEAGVPFQVVSGAGLVEVYIGVGPARIRKVFAEARKKAPSIVFIDELDAIGRTRATHAIGGTEERESTLNQLLIEMDGFDASDGVLVVGATNRPDVLDPALLRPGRFDRRLVVAPPDLRGRQAILAVHARNKPLGPTADLGVIAQRTPGFTGADLANVLNEAALLAGRHRRSGLGCEELEEAIDRQLTGPQRPSSALSSWEMQVIAYHEAGHALVSWCLAGGHDLHKVSILARGSSHGYTLAVPIEDRVLLTRSELEGQLAVLLGGRAAEEVVYGDPTTGAEDDLNRATALATKMVTDYGMSERAGPGRAGPAAERSGLGRGDQDPVSAEIARVVSEAHAAARGVLDSHRSHLDRLATQLVERETLEADDLEVVLAGVDRRAAVSGRSRDPRRQAARARSGVDGTQSPQPTTYPATERAKEFFGLGAAFSASPDHNGRC